MTKDELYMTQTLQLALKGLGLVSPNPLVGAVIVKNNKILATGYHHRFGAAHAEVDALKKINFQAKGATLYCNLEPCCHQGLTPPCVDQVIQSGIKKVVIAQKDPNPKVNGRSIRILRKNGIEVVVGICEKQARHINRFFNTFQQYQRPYVILKLAVSLDGKIAPAKKENKKPFWLSSKTSRELVHYWRAITDALLIGKNTALQDEPELNVRLKNNKWGPLFLKTFLGGFFTSKNQVWAFSVLKNKKPARIILTSNFKAPSKILEASSLKGPLVLAGLKSRIPGKKIKNVEFLACAAQKGQVNLKDLLSQLAQKNISSLLVEGGSQVAKSFLLSKFVDEIHLYQAPVKLGDQSLELFSAKDRQFLDRHYSDASYFDIDCDKLTLLFH
ncbi:MAG: hypothetical protein ACD_73C00069G0002 [uncultured bacterium]|nr:MAG: hypothetical protein ACD_73C00069G0002 [uncultured bacterium]